MPVDRAAVRDAAKYLRNVRPIEPTEIREYVDGRPDARVVRQVLRESAPSLGLVEHQDGTFRPVKSVPIDPAFDGVSAVPTEYVSVLEDLLVARYGPDWATGDSGEHLRETIRRFKSEYYRQHPVEYDEDVALGYAIYHLPAYYATAQYVFWDLARDERLDRSLRVLDIGAGVGGPALGLHDLIETDESGPALVEYHAVEPSESVAVLQSLLSETNRNFHWEIHQETAEAFEPTGPYDVVLFSNVLSELDDPVSVAESYRESLSDEGTMVGIAPADRNTSLGLRSVERALEDHRMTIYAPMVRLWPADRPTVDIWSFDERPDVETPSVQKRLAAEADRPAEFRHTSVKFSYSFLRTDGARRYAVDATEMPVTKLAAAEHHVTDRLDVLVAKLSADLSDDGHPLFTVSDGSERDRHFAVLVNETELNQLLREAEYGTLLFVERALVLWNDDEDAYNLVVDEETVVDPA
ncbi:small ribosomal subunit Rsm22 family protein [Halanaeroarchaeum sulfurireducens]|uniref:Methyltransferase family protein n=1 Tax=Halanaeroarchaeum sulfurireducens TaxID=1604004 RepID=A0A0F7PEU2_9EURY|nr:class I SAM-dependent methyltransferase [Halanaeroarchaeum sulfurireducens]AKH98119.1 methyltransferase family protein [Halanaeroarchaeum sulfurireducens]ALG82513.1 methyltransferase family protein [Halanaeroarchaeum sulfurireducens]